MKNFNTIFTIIFIIFFSFLPAISQKIPLKAIGRIYLNPNDTTSIGTAFVAGESKSIYTCSHVVKADTMWFEGYNSKFIFKIKLKYNLPNDDVALLERIAGEQIESLEFGDFNSVQPGDTIIYFGWDDSLNAYGREKVIVYSKGSVLTKSLKSKVKADFLEYMGEAKPGYSGGPVFNNDGKVIAMIRESWIMKSIKNDKEWKINRAFSTDTLKILDLRLGEDK